MKNIWGNKDYSVSFFQILRKSHFKALLSSQPASCFPILLNVELTSLISVNTMLAFS